MLDHPFCVQSRRTQNYAIPILTPFPRSGDVDSIYKLIIELAIYEREPDAVKNTPKQLLEDGFGEHPFFHTFVIDRIDQERTSSAVFLYF